MTDKYTRRISRYSVFFLVLVIILITGAVWQYRGLMVEIDDGTNPMLYNMGRQKSDGASPLSLRIALVQSEDTAAALGSDRQSYYNMINVWEEFLDSINLNYSVVPNIPLSDDAESFNLIILPSVTCIGEADSDGIKDFLKTGKGVLMTWASGVRDQRGRWRKYSILQEICGLDVADPPPELTGGLSSFLLLSHSFIGMSSPPGLSIDLTCYDKPLSARVVEKRTIIDGIWKKDDDGSPNHSINLTDELAAIVHGNYLGGRYVWLGFPLTSGIGAPEQTQALRSIIREAILWAGDQPRANKPMWPGEQSSVMSISLNIKTPEDIRPDIFKLARRYHINLTSFIDMRLAMNNPTIVLAAAEAGEVALLANESEAVNIDKGYLIKLRKRVKEITGKAVIGFRVTGSVEDETYETILRAGFEYLSTPDFDRIVPKIVRSYRPVPVLTKPRYLWLVPEMPACTQPCSSVLLINELSQTVALGGYYCLSITPGQYSADLTDHLERLIISAQKENVWITTVRDMKKAWAWWDNIKISTKPFSANRTSIHVSNTGRKSASGITINMYFPNPIDDLEIKGMMLGTEIPKASSDDGKHWKLKLKRLGAGKNVAYTVKASSDKQ